MKSFGESEAGEKKDKTSREADSESVSGFGAHVDYDEEDCHKSLSLVSLDIDSEFDKDKPSNAYSNPLKNQFNFNAELNIDLDSKDNA